MVALFIGRLFHECGVVSGCLDAIIVGLIRGYAFKRSSGFLMLCTWRFCFSFPDVAKTYPVFDFRPMNYLAAYADLPIRGLLWGYQGVALGIVYRIRMTARFRGCSREIRGDFVILFYNLRISFSIGWLILIRAISEVE